jgi:hypothetical protein
MILMWLPYDSRQAIALCDIKEQNRGVRHEPLPRWKLILLWSVAIALSPVSP